MELGWTNKQTLPGSKLADGVEMGEFHLFQEGYGAKHDMDTSSCKFQINF
jgi:hypothetical protein